MLQSLHGLRLCPSEGSIFEVLCDNNNMCEVHNLEATNV
ncbi:hypothetical protein NOR51B_20 [Luminiphilus syltensis NOR5-1B]|uniref:Uncharacterized protein n=1 Tax=Luminiphilus syltensis NOR5-1B TaxID=565045 RepID=B8KVU5_9GAMM|nr:hypothetical protein NOR51B_20 [Luminiphilus syltensis NOR5-1B]